MRNRVTAAAAFLDWLDMRGSRPIVLPAPLDALAGALAAGRKAPGTSLLDVPCSWLFPDAGQSPLTEDALAQRLHALGTAPEQ